MNSLIVPWKHQNIRSGRSYSLVKRRVVAFLIWALIAVVYTVLKRQSSKGFANWYSPSSSSARLPVLTLNWKESSSDFQASHVDFGDEIACSAIRNVARSDQCAFAKAYCSGKDSGVIDYIEFYYCYMTNNRPLAIALVLCWLAFLFSNLGISASDFFSTNLVTISWLLQLPDSVVGVTFLALGNGSPDVLSTFAAVRVDSAGLAIGELLGSALFICAIVCGTICILQPFCVPKQHFLRDVLFFTGAVLLVITFLIHNGCLSLWQSLTMITYYTAYVLFVFFFGGDTAVEESPLPVDNHLCLPLPAYSPLSSPLPDNMSIVSLFSEQFLGDDVEAFPSSSSAALLTRSNPHLIAVSDVGSGSHERVPLSPSARTIRPSLLGALEMKSHLNEGLIQNSFASPTTFGDDLSPSQPNESNSAVRSPFLSPYSVSHDDFASLPLPPTADYLSVTSTQQWSTSRFPSPEPFQPSLLKLLFPTLCNFSKKTVFQRVLDILAAPSVLLFTLTLPVYQSPRHPIEPIGPLEEATYPAGQAWNRSLRALQCFLSPLVFVFITFSGATLFVAIPVSLILSTVTVYLLYKHTSPTEPPRFLPWVSLLGFFMGILWISSIANEVVGILQALGIIFSLNESILGLTIFAAGNSLSDLVADIMITRAGYPGMAMGGVFGGPMLNILLGIGISSFYSSLSHQDKSCTVEFPAALSITAVFLLLCLLTTLIYVPRHGYQMDRKLGVGLILLYCTGTGLCILQLLLK
ncbi:sodium/calcium exchanger [Schizosaccharomyces japonicus yFS275]|uniref:Sodium/calcium exchanger n=1 Tax=Schizosaccharomyces japonicus (strain yFS275 / FY16936) TaxID=402676 RepID=B6K816_SCHJY|nr:sodium/calcium exchanger [Schizosaccharomyces japonicus yFS275]EEB09670.1 sodium/calcium exchanger [Schizosaccharomyces japonicus yFS275]